jgi:hypothetical protein
MRKFVPLFAGVACVALLSGCAGKHRGLGGSGPDEFAVARQAPLVIPPDFALVPPSPGAARVQENNGQQQTLDALFGGRAQRSAGENAALGAIGPDASDPGIRSSAGDADTNVVDKGATTRDIVAAPEGDGQDARASTGTGTPPPAK